MILKFRIWDDSAQLYGGDLPRLQRGIMLGWAIENGGNIVKVTECATASRIYIISILGEDAAMFKMKFPNYKNHMLGFDHAR